MTKRVQDIIAKHRSEKPSGKGWVDAIGDALFGSRTEDPNRSELQQAYADYDAATNEVDDLEEQVSDAEAALDKLKRSLEEAQRRADQIYQTIQRLKN